MSGYDYKAFVTYSHSDSRAAAWLQRAIESYRVPPRLARESDAPAVPRRLQPVFRDRSELPAGSNLPETINDALARSEFLIVVCSPAARESQWVNLEIRQFLETHGHERILCLIVDGEPFAAATSGDPAAECFPPALGYVRRASGGGVERAAEPIAADLRRGGDGKRLARTKIVAGLLGIGVDTLIQRDNRRRYWRMAGLSAISATGMVVMAIMALVAIDARKGEELRRAEAEDLIEFMLSDLRQRLEAVGRLDVLNAVGEEAIAYYSRVDLAEHTEESLGRRARAFHLLGEVDELRGDMDKARAAFEEAYASTGELLRRSADDGERVYDHAQSVFWLGFLDWQLGNLEQAGSAFREYLALAEELVELDRSNTDWVVELAYASINLGTYLLETGSAGESIAWFDRGQQILEEVTGGSVANTDWVISLAQTHAWSADAHRDTGLLSQASEHRMAEAALYKEILQSDPGNQDIHQALIVSHKARAQLHLYQGELDLAVQHYRTAKQYADDLLRLEPDNTFTMSVALSVYTELAEALFYRDRDSASRELLGQAEVLARQLNARDPNVLDWRLITIEIRILRGRIDGIGDGVEQAIDSLTSAIDELEGIVAENPAAARARYRLGKSWVVISEVYERAGDLAARDRAIDAAIVELESVEDELTLAERALLASAYAAGGNLAAAEALSREFRRMNFRHPQFEPPTM